MEGPKETQEIESTVTPQSSGLVHVNLDFNDGIRGEAYLEPAIVTRLQQGDNELMEQLRYELYGNAVELVESKANTDVLQPSEFVTTANTVPAGVTSVGLTYDIPVANTMAEVTAVPITKRKSEFIDVMVEQDEVKKPKLAADSNIGKIELCEKNTDGSVTLIEKLKETNHMDFTADEKFPLKKKLQRPRRYLKYSLEDRDKATQLVLDGKMTISEVQKEFGIPQATMCDMVKRVGGTRFKCDLCSKGFPMEHMLEKHRQQHFRNNLCSYCGHASVTACALKRHIFTCHPGEAELEFGDEYINYTLTKFKCNKWNYQSTRQLFEEYGKILQNGDSAHENMHVWKELADTFWNQNFFVTPAQVQRKWRTLLRSYKIFKEGGQKDKQPRFYHEMETFLHVNANKNIDFGEVEDVVDDNAHKKDREESTINTKQSVWTAELVSLLLQEMEQRVEAFKDPFVEDKKVWCEIAKILCKGGIVFGSKHLEVKWNQLKKTCKEKGWDVLTQIKSGEDSENENDNDEDYKCYGEKLCQLIKIMDEREDKITDPEYIPIEYYKNGVPQKWDVDAINVIIDYYDEYLTSIQEHPEPNMSKNIICDYIAKMMQERNEGYTMVSRQIDARWTVIVREVSKPTTESIEFPYGRRLLDVLKHEENLKKKKVPTATLR